MANIIDSSHLGIQQQPSRDTINPKFHTYIYYDTPKYHHNLLFYRYPRWDHHCEYPQGLNKLEIFYGGYQFIVNLLISSCPDPILYIEISW